MPPSPHPEGSEMSRLLEREVARIDALSESSRAISWMRSQETRFLQWQQEIARIPAPPFAETARAEWLRDRFVEFGLEDVSIDSVGNVFGMRPGAGHHCISLSAHLDTVFPAGTPLNIRQEGRRLYGPSVSDNAAGVTALLAVAAALQKSSLKHRLPMLFIGNVGEEGEGDLRGMRHIFCHSRWRDVIRASVVLDGAGSDTIVAEALGSRRFEVIVRGPGGHSWSDFGAPNPIVVLANTVCSFSQTSVPTSPKTTFNVGTIRGGTSVNSIPESGSMRVDIRSTSRAEIERLETALRRALDAAVEEESRATDVRVANPRRAYSLNCEIVPIGDRPAGELDPDANILQVIRAVDSHLGNTAQIQRASTDANIPLSLGREAIAIGAGGTGGGAHTLQEWFDCSGRELALKRILLTMLALAGA
jgi:tripeptide aminopeptidase